MLWTKCNYHLQWGKFVVEVFPHERQVQQVKRRFFRRGTPAKNSNNQKFKLVHWMFLLWAQLNFKFCARCLATHKRCSNLFCCEFFPPNLTSSRSREKCGSWVISPSMICKRRKEPHDPRSSAVLSFRYKKHEKRRECKSSLTPDNWFFLKMPLKAFDLSMSQCEEDIQSKKCEHAHRQKRRFVCWRGKTAKFQLDQRKMPLFFTYLGHKYQKKF